MKKKHEKSVITGRYKAIVGAGAGSGDETF
jgi:hypothetical protein